MFQSQIPNHFLSYVIKHAVYLINQVPSPINWNKTSFELLHKQSPNFVTLKVFGCLAYASTHKLKLWQWIRPRISWTLLLMLDPLGASGSSKSSIAPTMVWNDTRLGLSPKLSPKLLITLKPSPLLWKLRQFVLFLLWPPSIAGNFSNLMSTMHSFMGISLRKSTWSLPLVSMVHIHLNVANSLSLCMASNKPIEHGMKNSPFFSCLVDIIKLMPIIAFSSKLISPTL